jgi:RNA polymerase sigma-70 factor, ECF subfamily
VYGTAQSDQNAAGANAVSNFCRSFERFRTARVFQSGDDLMDPSDQAAHRMLVVRCQQGDRQAMEELFLRHNRALGYYLGRLLGREEVADLQQEVWLIVLRRLRQLREPDAFVVWFYQIARRKALGRLEARRRGRIVDSETAEEPIDASEPRFSTEDAEAIHKNIAALSDAHREVIVLRFVEDLTYDQIAEVTGSNAGTVRSRLHYAKLLLQKRLEDFRERI